MDKHRIGTVTLVETETKAVPEMGTGTRMGKGTGTRTGSGTAEERQRSAIHHMRAVDAMWETGETGWKVEKT